MEHVIQNLITDREDDAVKISAVLDEIEDLRTKQVKWELVVKFLKELKEKLYKTIDIPDKWSDLENWENSEMSEEDISKRKLVTVRIMISDLVREIEGKELQ